MAGLRQSVVLHVCLDTAATRLLFAEQIICEVQLVLRTFIALEVCPQGTLGMGYDENTQSCHHVFECIQSYDSIIFVVI